MNWAAANGFIGASPVGVVDKLLPKQPGKRERVEHQPALPWRLLPTFLSGVLHAGETNITRHMLELLILAGCRSGELRYMEWQEIDFSNAIWTVPAPRMKAKVAHRVPLGPRAIEILEERLEQSETGEGLRQRGLKWRCRPALLTILVRTIDAREREQTAVFQRG